MKQKVALTEQTAYHAYANNGRPIPRRGSAPPPERIYQTTTTPVSPQKISPRNAGVYDPYTHTRTRNRYQALPVQEWYEEGEDEPVYQTKTPRSAVVYRRPYTHIEPVTHTDPLPDEQRRGFHPLVYLGMSMLIAVVFIAGYIYIPPAWQRHVDDVTYGYPRTYQTDADVEHGGVSHFLVLNLHGTIEVLEIPIHPSKTKPQLYIVTSYKGDGADLIPATVAFPDLNGDGKPDMQVIVLTRPNPTIWDFINDGTTFKPVHYSALQRSGFVSASLV